MVNVLAFVRPRSSNFPLVSGNQQEGLELPEEEADRAQAGHAAAPGAARLRGRWRGRAWREPSISLAERGDLGLDRLILPGAGWQEGERLAPGDDRVDGLGRAGSATSARALSRSEWTSRPQLGQFRRDGASSVPQPCAGPSHGRQTWPCARIGSRADVMRPGDDDRKLAVDLEGLPQGEGDNRQADRMRDAGDDRDGQGESEQDREADDRSRVDSIRPWSGHSLGGLVADGLLGLGLGRTTWGWATAFFFCFASISSSAAGITRAE